MVSVVFQHELVNKSSSDEPELFPCSIEWRGVRDSRVSLKQKDRELMHA